LMKELLERQVRQAEVIEGLKEGAVESRQKANMIEEKVEQ